MADEQRSDDNTTPYGRDSQPGGQGEPPEVDQPEPPADATQLIAGLDATEIIHDADATSMLPPPVDPYVDDSETSVLPAPNRGGQPSPDATSVLPTEPVWTGRAGVRPAEPADPDRTQPALTNDQQGESPRWWTPLLLGLLALLLLAGVILGVWLSLRDSSAPLPSPTPSPTSVAPPTSAAPSPTLSATPSLSASPAPVLVVVPANLVGMTSSAAVDAVVAAGLVPSLTYEASSQPAGTVIATAPEPGAQAQAGAVVVLTIAVAQPSPSASASAAPVSPSPSS